MVPVRYNIRSLFVRKLTTGATAIGIAMVVFVFAGALMAGEGIKRAMGNAGRDDIAIVLRDGSDAELSSSVKPEVLGMLRERPEVARVEGREGVIGEVVVIITAELADGSGGLSNVMIRGTPAGGIEFRPELKVVRGRAPKPGTNEVMVGRAISGRFKGIATGQSFDLRRNRPFQVVGVFEAAGSSYESEVWGDADVIATALGRSASVSSARIRLTSASQFPTFKASLEADKRLGVEVMRESDYLKKQSEQLQGFLVFMFVAIAVMFSVAAMIGAAITMNGAVANRTREIGTLRALGFSRRAILFSFVLEAIFLAALGGAVGTAFVLVLTRFQFPIMNFQTFSEIVIGFRATPTIMAVSLGFSMIMGLIGGLVPAIRAARVSPVEAMRG
ncbi:MAG TPA: ABC transporter permease [Kofleriaceae bacterium]|nr:ABC transporter permease [Kofleriaceae bacterium]